MVYMASKSHITKQLKNYSYVRKAVIDCQVGY
jgi:hypothetical protein